MKIGYSFWGFLNEGILDTPDGGRAHRLPFLKALINEGVEIYCLQKNRDLEEARNYKPINNLYFDDGLPQLDSIIMEYRWPIVGRNTLDDKNNKNFTPDLIRQNELLEYYQGKIPIIIWDKDLKFQDNRDTSNYIFAEATFKPKRKSLQLLFSFDKNLYNNSFENILSYSQKDKVFDLIYIGNQYERDKTFKNYIDYAGQFLPSPPLVYGNWTKYENKYRNNLLDFPNVKFNDRVLYKDIFSLYEKSFATVLIAPERYYTQGQVTQRLFEAISECTIPFTPIEYKNTGIPIISDLYVKDGKDIFDKLKYFRKKGDAHIKTTLEKQLKKLNVFFPDIQAKKAIKSLVEFNER